MATTYQYEIYLDVEIVFPRAKGATYPPLAYSNNELVVITSSRKLNDAFVCNAAIRQVTSRVRSIMPGSLAGFPLTATCTHVYLTSY